LRQRVSFEALCVQQRAPQDEVGGKYAGRRGPAWELPFCSLFGGELLEPRENVSLRRTGSAETAAPDCDETVQGIGWRAREDVLLSRIFAGLVRRRHSQSSGAMSLATLSGMLADESGPKKLR